MHGDFKGTVEKLKCKCDVITLCGWRLWQHCLSNVTILGFRVHKEFHPTNAFGCHAVYRLPWREVESRLCEVINSNAITHEKAQHVCGFQLCG